MEDTKILDQFAKEATKKLNEGLPLTKKELQSLNSLFVESSYFAHVKFGIENGRLEPEELLFRTDPTKIGTPGFLYLVSFLIKNNLDVNYYVDGPYGTKIHILVFLSTLSGTTDNFKFVADLFKEAGCNLGLAGYLQKNSSSREGNTVADLIGAGLLNGISKQTFSVPVGSGPDNKIEFEWGKEMRPILTDKSEEEDFVNMNDRDMDDLKKTYLMSVMCISEAINSIKKINDKCLFYNEFGGMKQGMYFAINSQNYEIFSIILQKGSLCNYVEMTELIIRYNLAGEKKDTILKKAYGKMILYAVESGSEIDSSQLRLLSLEATVELLDKIKEAYSQPEWKKLCNKSNLSNNDRGNYKIRKIAFDLNINFSLPPHKICEKLDQINNTDRMEYVRASIARQEERVARSLIEIGDLRPEDKLESCRCDKQTMLLNNPYAYNDARMAFYKDEEDGKLWCFTSDMFDSLIDSKINPYNKRPLPELFVETITSQVNILESLDLKPDKDMRSVGETLEDIFDKRKEINNRLSDDVYNSFVTCYSVVAQKTEEDFRSNSIKDSKELLEKIIILYFYYFSDCNKNSPKENPFTGKKKISGDTIPELELIPKSKDIMEIFTKAKIVENLQVSKHGELYYKVISYMLQDFFKKSDKYLNTTKNYQNNIDFFQKIYVKLSLI